MVFLRNHARRERERDRINELPEHLIHHIFSFLPIECSVSTSKLSTKWRYLWTFTPIIDFLEWQSMFVGEMEATTFMRFVDRLLSFRQDIDSPLIK
ncbi:hypothetical protein MKX03_037664 [Papaver bracteatum]|nr:hypothetical protein MKX03_037664 [Papaver bracteatum]